MPKMRLLLTSLLSNRVRQILRMGRKQPVMSMGSRTRDDRDVSHVGSMVTGEVVERKEVVAGEVRVAMPLHRRGMSVARVLVMMARAAPGRALPVVAVVSVVAQVVAAAKGIRAGEVRRVRRVIRVMGRDRVRLGS